MKRRRARINSIRGFSLSLSFFLYLFVLGYSERRHFDRVHGDSVALVVIPPMRCDNNSARRAQVDARPGSFEISSTLLLSFFNGSLLWVYICSLVGSCAMSLLE